MNTIAGKAVAFGEALTEEFRIYQAHVVENARALAQGLMERGLRLVSGGTDNHLLLIDVKHSGLTGKVAQARLARVGLTVNKNTIPFETEKPTVASGIRIGTPQITTRGLGQNDMAELADVIAAVLQAPQDQDPDPYLARVQALAEAFPLPGI